MKKPSILVTGCDSVFYQFMDEALQSLAALNIDQKSEIGVLDLGLLPEQRQALRSLGCIICQPTWAFDVPEELRDRRQLGLVARTALRDYFPGFEIYIWFDADAWAQTPEFFDKLVDGARTQSAAVIRENGSGYRRTLLYHRWWFGHMMASYGPLTGARQAMKPAVNIGIMALSDMAPHWEAWIRHYQNFIVRRKKLNLDQHAFNAALEFENLPYALVPARCNWICTLSTPLWDDERKLFCEPNAAAVPISVLHLAGPDKRRAYQVRRTSGEITETPLTYAASQILGEQAEENPDDLAYAGLR